MIDHTHALVPAITRSVALPSQLALFFTKSSESAPGLPQARSVPKESLRTAPEKSRNFYSGARGLACFDFD